MKRIIIPALVAIIFTLGLTAQSLPDDLQAGVDIDRSGTNPALRDVMMDYRETQEAELAALYERQEAKASELSTLKKRIRAHKIWSWITIPLGVVAAGTAGYFIYASDEAYQNYLDASTTANRVDRSRHRHCLDQPESGEAGRGVSGH